MNAAPPGRRVDGPWETPGFAWNALVIAAELGLAATLMLWPLLSVGYGPWWFGYGPVLAGRVLVLAAALVLRRTARRACWGGCAKWFPRPEPIAAWRPCRDKNAEQPPATEPDADPSDRAGYQRWAFARGSAETLVVLVASLCFFEAALESVAWMLARGGGFPRHPFVPEFPAMLQLAKLAILFLAAAVRSGTRAARF